MKQSSAAGGRSHLLVLMTLALPAIVEQLLLTLVRYVDTAMVGSLGANATAAVSITSSPTWLIASIMAAVGVGYSVQVAHSIGAQDYDTTAKVVRQTLLAVLVIGLSLCGICLLIAPFLPGWMGAEEAIVADSILYLQIYVLSLPFQTASYAFSAILRCMGDTRTPLVLNTTANFLNVVFNFLFIFPTRQVTLGAAVLTLPGLGLGVAGAALGTTLSTAITGIGMALITMFGKQNLYIITRKDDFRPDKTIIKRALELGIPNALEHATVSAGQVFITRINASLGTTALAAAHVAITAEGLSYMPADGISYAATALVGQSYGAGEYKNAKKYGALSGWAGFFCSTFMGLLLFIFATPLSAIFSSDSGVISLSADMLRIVAVCEPLFGVSIVLSGALRGLGDTRVPMFISLAGMWLIRCTTAPLFVYVLGTGLAGSWYAMVLDLCFRGLFCALRFQRYSSRIVARQQAENALQS